MKTLIATLAADCGHSADAIAKWRQRGFVPAKNRDAIADAAAKIGRRIRREDWSWQPTPAQQTKRAA